jgi:hypothetical protein
MVGGAIGVAVLGALVNAGYRDQIDVGGLPPATAEAVRDGAATGVQAAQRIGSTELLESVRAAFVHGFDVMLASGAGIALVGLVLGVLFLPNRPNQPEPATPTGPAPVDQVESAEPTDRVGRAARSDGESEHDVVRS